MRALCLIVAAVLATTPSLCTAAESYMTHQGKLLYEFIDEDSVRVVESGVRAATVTDVLLGSFAVNSGYKAVVRSMRFRCDHKTSWVEQQVTLSSIGEPLTEGGRTVEAAIRITDAREAARFRFVCADDRRFADYYDESPISSADKLFALLNAPR